jgi:acetate kinase
MSDAILVINAGSSSLKFALFGARQEPSRQALLCSGEISGIGHSARFEWVDDMGASLEGPQLPPDATHETGLGLLLPWLQQRFPTYRLAAAGHRVVHGGPRFAAPVRIDEAVLVEIRRLIPLAPLHQPHHVRAIEALTRLHPALLQVACFDTAFHQGQPPVVTSFALPRSLTDEGVRRYGFHGLSYEYIVSVLPEVVGRETADGRVVVAHLGSGASLCALRGRKSVATTMGFTALDGLPMSERCGALDPGVVLYLIEQKGMRASDVGAMLYHASGLLGVSGLSGDMRVLLSSHDPHAAAAIDLFVYRISRELGSLAAALGGIDALVFTAGIGEHATQIRQRVCDAAAWLGVESDSAANLAGGPRLTRKGSEVSAWVVPTDEDLMIARHTWRLLAERSIPRGGEGRL